MLPGCAPGGLSAQKRPEDQLSTIRTYHGKSSLLHTGSFFLEAEQTSIFNISLVFSVYNHTRTDIRAPLSSGNSGRLYTLFRVCIFDERSIPKAPQSSAGGHGSFLHRQEDAPWSPTVVHQSPRGAQMFHFAKRAARVALMPVPLCFTPPNRYHLFLEVELPDSRGNVQIAFLSEAMSRSPSRESSCSSFRSAATGNARSQTHRQRRIHAFGPQANWPKRDAIPRSCNQHFFCSKQS